MDNNSKEIIITRDSIVVDIQKAFNLFYPYLKIEFSTSPKGVLSLKKHSINPQNSIGKITNLTSTLKLNVDEDRTVAEIEKECRELLGLSIQVFRKSGNVWNVISLTDGWTLESQNKAGEFISTEMSAAS
ncbi:hypothetical protein [Segetibacter koreensis]|uniref:hypothetical protein n=1 Tax=Segetibacter koreensis TaxID=398037 RepID=UPI00035C773C|nr:hypothetical protein [Segetibacter koreensis]